MNKSKDKDIRSKLKNTTTYEQFVNTHNLKIRLSGEYGSFGLTMISGQRRVFQFIKTKKQINQRNIQQGQEIFMFESILYLNKSVQRERESEGVKKGGGGAERIERASDFARARDCI